MNSHNSKRKVQEMKKKKLIEIIIQEVPALNTLQVVNAVKKRFNVRVSNRSVQRVRKQMMKGNNQMSKDEWDTGQYDEDKTEKNDQPKNLNSLSDDQITLLNMINEGGWSIQQLATQNDASEDWVRSTIKTLSHMITGDVLDEDDPNVYNLTKGTQAILDELDAIPSTTWENEVIKETTKPAAPREDFWEVEQDTVTACSKCDKAVDVFMNITSRRKAMLYMKWAGAREWLAYLVGEKINNTYNITDLYLPDQRTSATLVDNVNTEEYNQRSIVGVIHSHHDMGAGDADRPSFSGHDDNFINSNHNLSLLAGKSGNGFKIVGIARAKTPCGAFMKVKANVRSLVENPEADKVLKDEFLEKTQTQTYVNVNNVTVSYGNGYGYGHNPFYARKTGEKKTLTPDENGVVRTRGGDFHFTKK
jgi:hypothetical protein